MARWTTGFYPGHRHVNHGLLCVVCAVFSDVDDDPARNEFVALADLFVCVHDNVGVHWSLDRVPFLFAAILPQLGAKVCHGSSIDHSLLDCVRMWRFCVAIVVRILEGTLVAVEDGPSPIELFEVLQRLPAKHQRHPSRGAEANPCGFKRHSRSAFLALGSMALTLAERRKPSGDQGLNRALKNTGWLAPFRLHDTQSQCHWAIATGSIPLELFRRLVEFKNGVNIVAFVVCVSYWFMKRDF
jgi:hypothetical protein